MDLISNVTGLVGGLAGGKEGIGGIAQSGLLAGQDITSLFDKGDKHHVGKSLGLAQSLLGGILGGGK